MMNIIWTSLIWFLALLCLKYFKDKIIFLQKERIAMLEAKWIKEQKRVLKKNGLIIKRMN